VNRELGILSGYAVAVAAVGLALGSSTASPARCEFLQRTTEHWVAEAGHKAET
jgi:hypothetical protein